MRTRLNEWWKKLEGFRYVLLIALVGAALLLWPTGAQREKQADEASAEETRIAAVLTQIEGVGRTQVLLSENGAVIVCEGASDPSVRLAVTQAVRCYTGLGAHEVVIFKSDE